MEIAGITLRVLEIITVILCGIRLAVPPGHFRWERLWTKVLFCSGIIFWLVINIANIYFFRFSSVAEAITGSGLFIWLIIFYSTYFWQLFAQFFVYWYTVYAFRHSICFYIVLFRTYSFAELCNDCGWSWMALDSDMWNGSDDYCCN